MTREDFLDDQKTQTAVMHRPLIIGEAVKRLSQKCRDSAPGVPWSKIAGTRDTLIHLYEGIDLIEVWMMTQKHVPELHDQAAKLLDD